MPIQLVSDWSFVPVRTNFYHLGTIDTAFRTNEYSAAFALSMNDFIYIIVSITLDCRVRGRGRVRAQYKWVLEFDSTCSKSKQSEL